MSEFVTSSQNAQQYQHKEISIIIKLPKYFLDIYKI